MKNLTQFLFMLLCICLPTTAFADANKDKDDDSKYLAGAVPEVDGKVVFTKEFSIPGMSQEEIFKRMQAWMEARLKKNANTSRVVYTNPEEGQIVGTGDEWIVFSSSALSLDRTKILYQLSVVCAPEKCTMEVEKIRFNYREGKEKYTAEEWIVDKYALNKAKTKLVRGLAKWRRKTVDFVDDLALGAAEALSASTAKKAAEAAEQKETKKKEKRVVNSGPIVIAPKAEVEVKTPAETGKVTVIPATPLTPGHSCNVRYSARLQRSSSGSIAGKCHPNGCGQVSACNRLGCFQHDHDDSKRRWFIGQIIRQACYFQLPFSRPALRTDGDGRNLHRSFLSGKPNRTVSCFGM